MTARLVAVCILLAAYAASCFYAYEKGKASVITDVLSGVTTQQKKQEAVAKEDVIQTTTDTATITKLEAERDALRTKNIKLQAAAKAARNSEAPPEHACTIEPSVLSELQDAARSTAPASVKLSPGR